MLGVLATLPLQSGADRLARGRRGRDRPGRWPGSAWLWIGGLSLEAARRRAALTAELRFSASVQDLRAVVLLRRQLASEAPAAPTMAAAAGPAARSAPDPAARLAELPALAGWPALARTLVLGARRGRRSRSAPGAGSTPLLVLPGVRAAGRGARPGRAARAGGRPPDSRRDLLPVEPDIADHAPPVRAVRRRWRSSLLGGVGGGAGPRRSAHDASGVGRGDGRADGAGPALLRGDQRDQRSLRLPPHPRARLRADAPCRSSSPSSRSRLPVLVAREAARAGTAARPRRSAPRSWSLLARRRAMAWWLGSRAQKGSEVTS